MTEKIIVTLLLFILLIPSISLASESTELLKKGMNEAIGIQSTTTDTPGEKTTDTGIRAINFPVFIGTLIKTILSMLGVVFIVLVIYAGALWVFSQGDTTKIAKAKQILITGIIGMIIILGSYIITSFITSAILSAQSN